MANELPTPDKTIVIDTPNATLDKIAGKAETPVTTETTEKPVVEQTKEESNSIRSFPDENEPVNEGDPKGEPDKNKAPDNEPADEPVDLNEIVLEVDGQERPVTELLDERDALAKRVAQIDGDPFLKGLIEHYQANGNIDAYYEAKGVDWDKKDSLEVLRVKFDKDNADMDSKIREKLWKRKIATEYMIKEGLSQEELESDDYQISQGLLERDARKVREEFKASQQKYQAPEREKEQAPAQKFDPAAYKNQLLQDKDIQAFSKNKLIAIGIKDASGKTLGFEPKNPDQIVEMMVDDRKFWGAFIDPKTGKIDRVKQARAYAYVQDPDFYEQSLVNLGKNLLLEDRLKEEKGIDDRLNRKDGGASPKESFAKGFLSAALKQKK